MAKLKMFEMVVDCGEDHIIRVYRAGTSKKQVMQQYSGNGEYLKVAEVTEDFGISLTKVWAALEKAGFGEAEQYAIRDCIANGYANVVRG